LAWITFLGILVLELFLIGPFFVLLHEIGHVLPMWTRSKSLIIQLGYPILKFKKPFIFNIGRLKITIFPIIFFFGFCHASNWLDISKSRQVFSIIGGPAVTLIRLF
jgi:hypothetical protein